MKKKLFLLFLFCCLYISWAAAQVKGTVKDPDGEALIGATVNEKGTTNSAVTNLDGEFQITLRNSANAILVVSYIGFEKQEVAVGNQRYIDIVMSYTAEALGEVVVTALGMKRDTRALGYAISTIKGEDMIKAGVTPNPLTMLYGKAAGVGIQSTAAGPMGGVRINIRGAQGLESTSKTRPLFVVDGVPIYDLESSMASRGYDPLNSFDYGSAVNDINAEDIESMEILKGAKAAVLYGSQGANGVVLITTKNGSGTRGLGVQISYGYETEVPYSLIKFQNEFGSGINEYDMSYADPERTQRRVVSSRWNFGPKFDGSPIMFFDGTIRKYEPYKDNYMALFKNGSTSSVTGVISGGFENGSMRLSLTNFDYNGTMQNQGQVKNSLSFNGQMKASQFARFEFVQNLFNSQSTNRRPNLQRFISYGAFNRDYDLASAMNSYKDENGYRISLSDLGNINESGWGWPSAYAGDQDGFFALLWRNNENRNHDNRINSITSVKTYLTFLPYLTLLLQGGVNYADTEYIKKDKVERKDPTTGNYGGGQFNYSRDRNVIQNYDAFLTFDKNITDRLSLNAFAGPSYRKDSYTSVGVGTMGGLKFPDFYSLSNGRTSPSGYDERISKYRQEDESIYSVSGQATFSYDMEFIFEFTGRNDWTSTLPKKNRSYFYPGTSLTWNFTERFNNIPYINYGKLRLSWADIGRPANRYYALRTYSMNTLPAPNTNINDIEGPKDLFSGDLKPEKKRELEVGFNLRMFKQNRLEVDMTYYNHISYNQIMGVPLSATTGAEKIRINAGEIKNQGFEFFVKGSPIKTSTFNWELTFTATRQWDEVVSLYPGITQFNTSSSGIDNRAEEGKRMGSLWMMDYLKDKDGNKIVNERGLYQISNRAEDQICVGSINPDLYGGLTTNFYFQGNWGMLNLMAGFDYRYGGKVLSYTNYYLMGNGLSIETLPYRNTEYGGLTWTENLADGTTRQRHDGLILPGVKADGTPNDIVISAYEHYRSFVHDDSRNWQPDMLMDNNYIKFREMALGFTFPKKISNQLRLQKLTLSLTARNLLYLYKSIPHIDAEALLGTGQDRWIENTNYPASRSFGFKVNVSF